MKIDFNDLGLTDYNYREKKDISPSERLAGAKDFLKKAVRNGHGWTVDMTLFNKLDSVIKQNNIAASKPALAKTKGNNRTEKVENISDMIGSWKGTMAQYDWGRTRVLSEEPIAIEIFQDTCLRVACLQKDSVISVFRSDKQLDNKWQDIQYEEIYTY